MTTTTGPHRTSRGAAVLRLSLSIRRLSSNSEVGSCITSDVAFLADMLCRSRNLISSFGELHRILSAAGAKHSLGLEAKSLAPSGDLLNFLYILGRHRAVFEKPANSGKQFLYAKEVVLSLGRFGGRRPTQGR